MVRGVAREAPSPRTARGRVMSQALIRKAALAGLQKRAAQRDLKLRKRQVGNPAGGRGPAGNQRQHDRSTMGGTIATVSVNPRQLRYMARSSKFSTLVANRNKQKLNQKNSPLRKPISQNPDLLKMATKPNNVDPREQRKLYQNAGAAMSPKRQNVEEEWKVIGEFRAKQFQEKRDAVRAIPSPAARLRPRPRPVRPGQAPCTPNPRPSPRAAPRAPPRRPHHPALTRARPTRRHACALQEKAKYRNDQQAMHKGLDAQMKRQMQKQRKAYSEKQRSLRMRWHAQ